MYDSAKQCVSVYRPPGFRAEPVHGVLPPPCGTTVQARSHIREAEPNEEQLLVHKLLWGGSIHSLVLPHLSVRGVDIVPSWVHIGPVVLVRQ